MSIGLIVLLALAAITLFYGVLIYNGLVNLKHNVAARLRIPNPACSRPRSSAASVRGSATGCTTLAASLRRTSR